MEQLSRYIRTAIRRYEPIKTEGLTLYPVLVRDYDDFAVMRAALSVMHQALPVRLMSKPLLQALYALDIERQQAGEPLTGLFSATILCLVLALRLGESGDVRAAMERVRLSLEPGDQTKLRAVIFDKDDGTTIEVTPAMYRKLRPIIAAQNGIELPDPEANPELVEAEQILSERNAPKLNASIERMISSVAALSGADESEIENWPVKKLQDRARAIQTALQYLAYMTAENQGSKWTGGNPHPHPFFERTDLKSGAHVGLDSFAGGEGKKAVQRASGT